MMAVCNLYHKAFCVRKKFRFKIKCDQFLHVDWDSSHSVRIVYVRKITR